MSNPKASNNRSRNPVRSKTVRKHQPKKTQVTSGETTYAREFPAESQNVMINIEPLQTVAVTHLRRDHPLRRLLLAERPLLKPEEYLAKLESWQVLLREDQ